MLRTHLLQSRIFRERIPVPPAYQRGGNPLWHSTLPLLQFFLRTLHEYNNNVSSNVLLKPTLGQKKNICAFTVTCQKNLGSVGRDYFLFLIIDKTEKWWIMQFFYLLCSQFRQKACTSSWINKTLLLVKQQKWLSEFCVKIHRVARVTVNTHIYFFGLKKLIHISSFLLTWNSEAILIAYFLLSKIAKINSTS
jgi:hypothetical protein